MATLKEHQAAMVDLLASGSGIPASASRLAHAMHDVLAHLGTPAERRVKELENTVGQLRAQVAKQRKEIAFLKMERNNAVAQLPEQAGCRKEDTQVLGDGAERLKQAFITAMDDANKWSGCRKEDTQVCEHDYDYYPDGITCLKCGHRK